MEIIKGSHKVLIECTHADIKQELIEDVFYKNIQFLYFSRVHFERKADSLAN